MRIPDAIIVPGILLIAAVLRLWRIASMTEFLGDQGRTMMVLSDWAATGAIPFAGPTTLTGQHLGPLFYYLMAPGYALSRSPAGVSVWSALIGVAAVYMLYRAVSDFFGRGPAILVSLLWAVSPSIVSSDRIIWEPNLVPFFALCFVFLLYRAHRSRQPVYWVGVGAVTGSLVQLHYPNVFFAAILALYVGYMTVREGKAFGVARVCALMLGGGIAVLIPFVWYEYTTGFADISGIARVFFAAGGSAPFSKRIFLYGVSDYGFRVFLRALPFMSKSAAMALTAGWILFAAARPTKKRVLFTVWLVGGVCGMALYRQVVHDHYLFFMTPVPFFMIAAVASAMGATWRGRRIAAAVLSAIILFQFGQTVRGFIPTNDIARTGAASAVMAADAGNAPFSFTLLRSRSFSDLHYRYFLRKLGVLPQRIDSDGYGKLYLVCDQADCPRVEEITERNTIAATCFDAHCQGQYPSIRLADWAYVRDQAVFAKGQALGRIYIFQRIHYDTIRL